MKRIRSIFVIALLIGCAVLAWVFFLKPTPVPKNIVEVSGRIESDDSAVAAKVAGRIREISVREGDKVTAGQVIAVLDDAQMVAREQQARTAQRVGHVVCGVTRGGDRFERPVCAFDDLAVGEPVVRPELHIAAGIEPLGFADVQLARGAVRPLRQHDRAGRGLDRTYGRRMIAVGVRDQDMGDGFTAHGIKQRLHMRRIVRPGIDDRDFAAADDVTHRALEGERARIVGEDAAQPVG